MKKLLFFGALAAMLLGTASCSNEMEPEMADGNVEFTIELPGAIESRAIADGLTATQLTVAVYDAEGNHLGDLDKNVEMSNKRATVRFQLVRGQKYSFAFWAQAPGAPYTFNTANATMTVNNYTSDCNDEKRDAFYAYRADMEITGTMNETITLYRPFAQLNFGASDVAAAAAAGVVPAKSYVEVKQVSTKFDLKTGHASSAEGDLVDAQFAMAAIPSPSEALTVEGTTYGWMAMNYFLVPADGENDKSNIETTLKLYEEGATDPVREITVPNVPVEKNHRTNILGNLFTDDVNFTIIIDEIFDTPDNNIFLPYLSDPAAIAEAIQTPGAVVNVAPGMDLNLDLSTVAEGVTINGNGSVLRFTTASSTLAHTINSENVTLNSIKIINEDNEPAIYLRASTATFDNVELVKNSQYGFKLLPGNGSEGTITFENCNLTTTSYTIQPNPGSVSKLVLNNTFVQGLYTINGNGNNGDIVVTNSTLKGWTSYNNGDAHTATFTDCKFIVNNETALGILCPHQDTQVTNCVFEWSGESEYGPCEHITLMPRNTSTTTFTNCKWSTGEPLDSRILATDKDSSYKDCIAVIGSETWKNLDGNANGNSWTLQ